MIQRGWLVLHQKDQEHWIPTTTVFTYFLLNQGIKFKTLDLNHAMIYEAYLFVCGT